MRRALSLRARLLFGALLWTAGLFILTAFLHSHVLSAHPALPRLFNRVFLSHTSLLGVVALVCMAAGLVQVRRGLVSFSDLRARLTAVRDGREPRLDGRYPGEVQPLVDELNALLADRDARVTRALAKAGDLAHGLKTPLAILAQEAERTGGRDGDVADTIGQQVERMRRQIDYHLAHARAAASTTDPAARCHVRVSVDGLVRTLLRLHDSRRLTIDVDVPADHEVRARREDLDEMLGNLLDNACKWAKARVVVASLVDGGGVAITIDDDGPGIEPSMREAVLGRGVRADEAAPGSGLGLAIVRDLAELYGGSVALDRSPAGGARATLRLPKGIVDSR
ncbi:MAG: hypothetical protein A3H96_12885 [Acidobacteria bacterium RIFCSPLOWO2_02_FULL_67_36]|nr:MAG: hypothetical protein A3H96_12885 [Acidobacteria bacterium RIFCSPLOWO2_02_FULL_67_36]OFW23518.1 MAG: hypothetical protein A3G21_06195 [Acidobacteria bacterium RIFCSPLOWO2_12_FULL_66_21]